MGMTLLFFLLFYTFPAGMVLYWTRRTPSSSSSRSSDDCGGGRECDTPKSEPRSRMGSGVADRRRVRGFRLLALAQSPPASFSKERVTFKSDTLTLVGFLFKPDGPAVSRPDLEPRQ